MKSLRFNFCFFLLLVCGFATTSLANASGGMEGGGGDTVAFEFVGFAQVLDRFIGTPGADSAFKIDPGLLHRLVGSVVVRSMPAAFFEGEVDAFNQDGKIVVNRNRWPSLSRKEKFTLVLHEYLGVANLDRHYEISVPFFAQFGSSLLFYSSTTCELHIRDALGSVRLLYGKEYHYVTHEKRYRMGCQDAVQCNAGADFAVYFPPEKQISFQANMTRKDGRVSVSLSVFDNTSKSDLRVVSTVLPEKAFASLGAPLEVTSMFENQQSAFQITFGCVQSHD